MLTIYLIAYYLYINKNQLPHVTTARPIWLISFSCFFKEIHGKRLKFRQYPHFLLNIRSKSEVLDVVIKITSSQALFSCYVGTLIMSDSIYYY